MSDDEGMGPTPKFCSASHRQRAYEVRRIEDLVQDLRAERDRLRAVVDEMRTNGPPHLARAVEAETERDRLRAVVDALREWRDLEMRLTMADISSTMLDQADAEGARQRMWLALAKWEERLDVSPAMGEETGP